MYHPQLSLVKGDCVVEPSAGPQALISRLQATDDNVMSPGKTPETA